MQPGAPGLWTPCKACVTARQAATLLGQCGSCMAQGRVPTVASPASTPPLRCTRACCLQTQHCLCLAFASPTSFPLTCSWGRVVTPLLLASISARRCGSMDRSICRPSSLLAYRCMLPQLSDCQGGHLLITPQSLNALPLCHTPPHIQFSSRPAGA